MKKIILFLGIFALLSVLTLKAQVTIGLNQAPNENAVLDLEAQNGNLGLLLPHVALTDTIGTVAPFTANVKGMFVYNTKDSVAAGLVEGIYYNDGRRWWPVNGGGAAGPWDISGSTDAARLNAQDIYQMGRVTIGKDTLVSSAMLNVVSNDKGILIPELTAAERQTITTPVDGLLIYNTDEGCFNYYNAQISDWQSLCGGAGAAKFTTRCDTIVVNGTYVQGSPLTSANYLTIPINVTSPGSFNIIGTTTNGYSFSYSGTITAKGQYFVNVPALGTPQAAQDDNVAITGGLDTCYTTISVQSNIATYSIDCASIAVNVSGGAYFVKGTALTTQTITLRVTVSAPGFYNISTPVTNGIAFGTQGNFMSAGTQTVTLTPLPNSTPTVNTSFPITVNANSPSGNVSCSTTIPMTLPPMTYATLGASSYYTWVSGGGARAEALSTANGSFSPTGVVKVVSLGQLWTTTDATTATNDLNNGVTATVNGVNYVNAQPDVVMFSSYGFTTPLPQGLATALENYVNKGGCLIFATSDNQGADAQVLLDGIFGSGEATAVNTNVAPYHTSNGNNYQVGLDLSNDPIVNGPFGNAVGKYWQEDNTGTIFVTQMPPNSVQICSANNPGTNCDVPATVSTVWYNNIKNFVYFGDSTGSDWDTDTSTTIFPSIFHQADGSPRSKLAGVWGNNCNASGAGNGTTVVNSILEFNAFAWCLQKAAVAGINPH